MLDAPLRDDDLGIIACNSFFIFKLVSNVYTLYIARMYDWFIYFERFFSFITYVYLIQLGAPSVTLVFE